MYYLETGADNHTRFRNALIAALSVHLVLVLAVSFEATKAQQYNTPQIEVTLAMHPGAVAPDDARNIAQANQLGSGNNAESTRVSTTSPLQSDTNATPQTASRAAQAQTRAQRDPVTTAAAALRHVSKQPDEQEQQTSEQQGVDPEISRINQEIASLQAELDDEAHDSVAQPRVRRLTAASAKQSVDAAYLLDWRQRLEAVGNQYYPQASIRYGMYGDLRMLVVIRSDGSLEDIQILSSSGFAVLDEAAIKIVRMAAPYTPVPAELRATTDQLEIVRTWHFQENALSSP
jgi:protein TonB